MHISYVCVYVVDSGITCVHIPNRDRMLIFIHTPVSNEIKYSQVLYVANLIWY